MAAFFENFIGTDELLRTSYWLHACMGKGDMIGWGG